MDADGAGVQADLTRLIAEDRLSVVALAAMTRVEPEKLSAFLADGASTAVESADQQILSPEDSAGLSRLAALLAHGLDIDDDERFRAILESLTAECGLTAEEIAKLTRVDVEDVSGALEDPGALSIETKYVLALRASYLINAANLARAR